MREPMREMHVLVAWKNRYREAGSAAQLFARVRVLMSGREKSVRRLFVRPSEGRLIVALLSQRSFAYLRV